ncbi:MAG: LuxR C-terminal-related transcriptional regulator [Syntrophomonas sp.]
MDSKPFKPTFLRRLRISNILEGIFRAPLFLLVSSMGYGKTVAVRDFLNTRTDLAYAWFSLSCTEDDEEWMWHKFAQCMEGINPGLATKMAQYGLPDTPMDMERILGLMRPAVTENTVIVLDDYHENKSERMNRLLTILARASIPELHLVVISRTHPDIPVEELALKGLCRELSQDRFEFDARETIELFSLNGFYLNTQEQTTLYQITDGWTAAIYLALLKYAENKTLDNTREITRLMKSAVYNKLDPGTQQVLLKLSFLDSFTVEGAIYITEDKKAAGLVHQLAANNCFIRYDNKSSTYSIHAIMKALLQDLFAGSEEDRDTVLSCCGDWYASLDKRIEAISFYHRAGAHEKILDIYERPGSTEFFDRAPQTIVRAFTGIDTTLKLSRPLAYLTYIYSLTAIDAEESVRLLYEAKAYYEADQDLVDKEQFLGEIALIESMLQFNDAPMMSEYQKRAYTLFGGTISRISNATEIFTFGAPHTLYLYHKEPGKLLALVETIEENVDYYTHIANGCGMGFEHAARAEFCLETGDLRQAELSAYKTVFKARTRNQMCLVICGSLCLARLAILNEHPFEAASWLEELQAETEAAGNPILLNSLEIALGYVYCCLGDLERIPKWLREGDLTNCNLFTQGMGVNYIVVGRAAVLRRSYAELEVIVETMRHTYRPNNHIFGLIYAGIYSAIAKNHLYGMDEALKELLPVMELARSDGIVTPFAENMPELNLILLGIERNYESTWLERVFQLGECFLKATEKFNFQEASKSLTSREREVLLMLAEGLSQKEVAEKLYLSPNTVKRHLQNAYEKLGTNNKILALKRARELNIL